MKGLSYQYSNSLLSLANKDNKSEVLYSEIESLLNSEFTSKSYLNFLSSPVVGYSDKESHLTNLLKSRIDDLLLKFILVVVKSKRAIYFKQMFESYMKSFEEIKMIKRVDIFTAHQLSNSALTLIKDSVVAKLKSYQLRFNVVVDCSLIGGYIVSWDGKQLDCSVKGSLSRLKSFVA